MTPLRVGVIGVGHLGRHHARIYATLQHVRLVGVLDIDRDRAVSVAQQHSVPFVSHISELLADVDAVSVAVPTSQHAAVVEQCLDHGVHVLVEKPITVSADEGRRLVAAARTRACVLQVGHVERFNPIMDLVRPWIHDPGFVECHRLSPFQARGTDVDVVLDLMIHDLDLLLSFDLGTVSTVESSGLAVLTDQIDIANARITFSGGCVATLTASRVSSGRLRKCRVFQPSVYVSIDYQARQAQVHHRSARAEHDDRVETETLCGDDDEPLRRELAAFVEAVRDRTAPVVSGEDGVRSLELAHHILEKIHSPAVCE